jgi:hypothetical protein
MSEPKTFNDLEANLRRDLASIRAILDTQIEDCDESIIQEKIMQLTQICGLAAQCKGSAKKLLELARLKAMLEMGTDYTGNLAMTFINSKCANELGLFEYADRINASLTHNIDGLRSVLSYRKSELENSLK